MKSRKSLLEHHKLWLLYSTAAKYKYIHCIHRNQNSWSPKLTTPNSNSASLQASYQTSDSEWAFKRRSCNITLRISTTKCFKVHLTFSLIVKSLITVLTFQCLVIQYINLVSCRTLPLIYIQFKNHRDWHLNWEVTRTRTTLVWKWASWYKWWRWRWQILKGWVCDEFQTSVTGWSEAADIGKAFELLWEVVFIEHWVCTVFHYLQRHGTKNWCKLVDTLRSKDEKNNKAR